MKLNDLSLLTVTFNNNLLTGMMLMSFYKQAGFMPPTVIVDNGTYIQADESMRRVFHVVDNFSHKLLPDEKQASRNHCVAIDYALKNSIQTKWVLLVDNDILFYPSIRPFLLNFNAEDYQCAGEIGYDDTPPNRLFPYFCLIDVEQFNKDKINYFDRSRITSFCTVGVPESRDRRLNVMDTGYSFYEDIKNIWNIFDFRINTVCVHLKSAMLAHKDIGIWFTEHTDLL